MENCPKKSLLADQSSMPPNSNVHIQPSSYSHSRELPERFRDNPFYFKRLPPNGSFQTSSINFSSNHEVDFQRYERIAEPCTAALIINNKLEYSPNEYSRVHDHSNETLLRTVDHAAKELFNVGRERGQVHDAQKMSISLRQMKEKDERLILEYCVKLYTRSSFLYRACHQDLADYYSLHDEKLFNYRKLLQLYINLYGKSYIGKIYRGVMLSDMQLKLHLAHDIDTMWYSPTYLSTSKCRRVAEIFGNVLMIIDIEESDDSQGKAVDISKLSAVPDEEEVLLTPTYELFKLKQPKFDSSLNKYIIYLTSKRFSMFSLTEEDVDIYRRPKRKRNYSGDKQDNRSSTPKDQFDESDDDSIVTKF